VLPPAGVNAIATLTVTWPVRASVCLAVPVACTVSATLAGIDEVVAVTCRTPAPFSVSLPAPGVFAVMVAVPLARFALVAPSVNALDAASGVKRAMYAASGSPPAAVKFPPT
jgi:hypothetical protein